MCIDQPQGQTGPAVCHFPDLPDSIFRDVTGALPPVALRELAFLPFTQIAVVANYIATEMQRNSGSSEVSQIRALIAAANAALPTSRVVAAASFVAAMRIWQQQVQSGGPWDHKPPILRRWDRWSYDWLENRLYFFDIWSNIHYGYVGLQANINRQLLLGGAGAAQVMDGTSDTSLWDSISESGVLQGIYNLDDPFDHNAIRLGMWLYYHHRDPRGITQSVVLSAVRRFKMQINSIHPRQYLTLPTWELNGPHQRYRTGSCAPASPPRRRPTGSIPLP